MNRLELACQLVRHMGLGWVAYRAWYAAYRRLGLLRVRMPARPWEDLPLGNYLTDPTLACPEAYLEYRRTRAPAFFFFSPADRTRFRPLLAQWDTPDNGPVREAEAIAEGRFRYFHHHIVDTGLPPDWHRNAFTGDVMPADRHWSELGSVGHGDVKVIWEPSRYAFAYTLVRAYWRTGDERYPELFWLLFEDWCEANPPNLGPNWMCGQEVALRVMAWCFALYGFLGSTATTGERVAKLAQATAVSGARIAANMTYALSQRNNHGLSEAVGLLTIGLLFPELRQAPKWAETGQRLVESQTAELLYYDGSCCQHSVVYERLMLHDLVWATRLTELHGRRLRDQALGRLQSSASLLHGMMDRDTGQLPRYGSDDGALILPLSNCPYGDFRPVVQLAGYTGDRHRRLGEGPWDEDLLWLYGPEALQSPVEDHQPTDLTADLRGYYTLRSPNGFAFVRCGGTAPGHRPGQADQLHVDLWWRGLNVAVDPGTYSYNANPPWDNALAETVCHNTVTVDGRSQMDRVGRFLWLPWAQGRCTRLVRSPSRALAYWEGVHNGYNRLPAPVTHRRGLLRLGGDNWVVVDKLQSTSAHDYRLHWLLADLPYAWDTESCRLMLDTSDGPYHVVTGSTGCGVSATVIRADPQSPRGWSSRHYLSKEPALSLAVYTRVPSAIMWTVLGPGVADVQFEDTKLGVSLRDTDYLVQLGHLDERGPVVQNARVRQHENTERSRR